MKQDNITTPRNDELASMEREADNIGEGITDNEPNYHDDPPGDALVDENPVAPNGMFGDHEDDFDIG